MTDIVVCSYVLTALCPAALVRDLCSGHAQWNGDECERCWVTRPLWLPQQCHGGSRVAAMLAAALRNHFRLQQEGGQEGLSATASATSLCLASVLLGGT